MTLKFVPRGVCASLIEFDVDDGKVRNVRFTGNCHGNAQGISSLVEGMDADEVIRKLEGIRCGFKNTSCPDQLAQALKAYKSKEDKKNDEI